MHKAAHVRALERDGESEIEAARPALRRKSSGHTAAPRGLAADGGGGEGGGFS